MQGHFAASTGRVVILALVPRIVILQGESQSGKTILLRTASWAGVKGCGECMEAKVLESPAEAQDAMPAGLGDEAIPWSRRWTVWPLSWICWRGIYMNGQVLRS